MISNKFQPSWHFLPRGWARLGSSLVVALLLLGGFWWALPGFARTEAQPHQPQVPSAADSDGQVAVVVQFDDQAHVARQVHWTTPISGLAALLQSGLEVVYVESQFGPAVCAIEGVGCPADDCFCDDTFYWAYSYWDGGAWQSYPVGSGSTLITQTGAVEGWRWGAFGDPQIELTRTTAAVDGLAWLAAQQVITDGGYGSAGSAVETLLAVGANQQVGTEWRVEEAAPSLAGYLAVQGAAYSRSSVAAAGKLAVAVSGAEVCFPALSLTPQDFYSPTLGAYSLETGQNSWAILGVLALGEPVPAAALNSLRAAVQPDGGWEWAPGWGTDTNATALALQALIAAGEAPTGTQVSKALTWLQSIQNDDGGFPYGPGPDAASDANSTAYVVQALIAAGEDPDGPAWSQAGNSAVDYLLARQLPNGSFEWQPGSGTNLLATQQIIPALLGQTFPLAQQTPAACPALRLPLLPNR